MRRDILNHSHQLMSPLNPVLRKAHFRDNLDLLSHQQQLQMHLLEAAEVRAKYQ